MSQNYVYSDNKIGHQQYDSASNKNQRPRFIIPTKDTPVSHYAKMSGMSNEEFMKWTGIKSTFIKKGTKIALPMDKVPEGKGIYALAKKYNMTLEEFCKLNKIPKPYNEYKAKKNEEFYVKPYKVANIASKQANQATANEDKRVKTELSAPEKENNLESREGFTGLASGALLGVNAINKSIWNSPFSPQEISQGLEQAASDNWGAVGKKQFDDFLKEINPKNVSEVLDAYSKANDGRSLISRITGEVMSTQETRKDAVMHIFNALAEGKGKRIPKSLRKEFVDELDKQFDSFGMVDTANLDEIIAKIQAVKVSKGQNITHKYTVASAEPDTKIEIVNDKKTSTFTAETLHKGAINSAKKEVKERFVQYCKANDIPYDENNLNLSVMDRIPAPIVKDGHIVAAETELLQPVSEPNGKVVILNPGHGGYSSRTGYFDPGSYSFVKKANGEYAPLLEYEKMNIYTEDTIDKLRANGYAVVMLGGHVETMSDQKSVSDLIARLLDGSKSGQKYNTDDIAFVSLHADSQPGMSGAGVCYDPNFKDDSKFAKIIQQNLNSDSWISAGLSERIPGKNGLQVLMQSENIPSVLLEVEYVNGSKSQNLESFKYQEKFEDRLLDGLDEYFGIK